MIGHTPGPWYAEGSDIGSAENITVGVAIAGRTDDGYISHAQVQANANLMAAAPELLEALRLAADAIDLAQAQVDSDNDRYNLCKRLVAVKRALAKAEGRDE